MYCQIIRIILYTSRKTSVSTQGWGRGEGGGLRCGQAVFAVCLLCIQQWVFKLSHSICRQNISFKVDNHTNPFRLSKVVALELCKTGWISHVLFRSQTLFMRYSTSLVTKDCRHNIFAKFDKQSVPSRHSGIVANRWKPNKLSSISP